ncbi:MAG: substrate-binding domain-containing protein [Gemmatimonadota bacterium]|nr:substrate-binding domain-containing protein [Gemmatimonadota bacterium]
MNLPLRTLLFSGLIAAAVMLDGACARAPAPLPGTIVVFNAGALALPVRQALDSFAQRNHLEARQESAGSVETVRKITELGRIPDLVALADTALFSRFLDGRLASPVTVLGRTRLVLAYTPASRYAGEITAENWPEVTTRPGVQVGRSDPALDPAGYRALIAMQLAERFYQRPGLADALRSAAGPQNVRPKSADLVALLQTGNLDYAWEYEAVARRLGLSFVSLPREVDLGDAELAPVYAAARVTVYGRGKVAAGPAGDGRPAARGSFVVQGAPIVFGAAVPTGAENSAAGRRFLTYLMSAEGRKIFGTFGLR